MAVGEEPANVLVVKRIHKSRPNAIRTSEFFEQHLNKTIETPDIFIRFLTPEPKIDEKIDWSCVDGNIRFKGKH